MSKILIIKCNINESGDFMDFFNMNFSELFKEKHGINVFHDISNKILLENSIDSSNYIELVFKIAFFDFWGLDESVIQNIINDTMLLQNISIKNLKFIHQNSIKNIQKYLQSTIDTENFKK